MPIGIGGAIIGSGLLGAGASIFGAGAQVTAEEAAINKMYQMYQQGLGVAEGALNPFISAGQGALQQYQGALPGLTQPFTAASLASTPGYQFTLGQGLKSTQNSFAAQGLGSSGAALKGAASPCQAAGPKRTRAIRQ
jgi:hypothetical protein